MKLQKPTAAFVGAAWAAVCLGITAYLIGLWNADMYLSEKGYYLTLLLYGLFSVIALQKSVRDRHEGIPVTDIFLGLSWFSTITAISLLTIGLWNASLLLSEKGFYGMAYALSLFAVITVQKNTRDLATTDLATDDTDGKTSKERSNKLVENIGLFLTTDRLPTEKPPESASKPTSL